MSPEQAQPFADVHRAFTAEKVVKGNLRREADLLEFLTEIARRYEVSAGVYTFLGAVRKARVSFYDHERKTYEPIALDQPLEIVSGTGNVSLRDGEIFVHVHVALSDREGRMCGGHLDPGTVVFAGEFALFDLGGRAFHRYHDEVTGLHLWGAG